MADRPAIPALTSVRGLAACWVAVYHYRLELPAGTPAAVMDVAALGYLAVDFFFQLSGFIIAYNYFWKLRDGGTGVADFIVARVARIWPLHIVTLFLVLLNPIAILLFSEARQLGERYDPALFLLNIPLVQNWGFTTALSWNIPAWSISAELGAYLLFPALVLLAGLAWRRLGRPGVAALLAGTHLAFMMTWDWLGVGIGGDIPRYGLARCVFQFAMGALLFLVWDGMAAAWRRRLDGAALALVAVGVVALALGAPDHLVATWLFAALIWLGLTAAANGRGLLAHPWALWLGEVSFAIYMIHYFVRDWVKFLFLGPQHGPLWAFGIYAAATLAAAALLHRLVELPARRGIQSLWRARRAASRRAPPTPLPGADAR
ncbi:acyltransferase family protein [Roseococcus sp. DSY-14]|uniref:acyltransferase family protein n=1 Tax=Roseococcus sp. DSY-14 TaxID=3369650 RepID=UPI00387B1737